MEVTRALNCFYYICTSWKAHSETRQEEVISDRFTITKSELACFDTLGGITRKDGLDYEGFCWFYSRDRRGRRHVGFGAGRAFCITPERNSNIWLSLSFLLLSGDICPNPGPRNVLDPCGICKKSVRSNQRGICCDLCDE